MAMVVENRILRVLGSDELAEVRRVLEPVSLVAGQTLGGESHQAACPPLVFVESGLVSCFSGEAGRDQTEVALIGRDGMVGLPAVLGARHDPFAYVVQRDGAGLAVPNHARSSLLRRGSALSEVLLHYAHAFMLQVAETGRSNARHTVAARLARWLLMAHDRIDGPEITITHESLSLVLGVRRPGVTVALHLLEGDHLIRARRGVVSILDRAGLMAMAGPSYGLAERTYPELAAGPSETGSASERQLTRVPVTDGALPPRPAPEAA